MEELKKNEQEIKAIIDATQSNDTELISMYAEKEDMEKGLSEAEKEYYSSRGEIEQFEKDQDLLLLEIQGKSTP